MTVEDEAQFREAFLAEIEKNPGRAPGQVALAIRLGQEPCFCLSHPQVILWREMLLEHGIKVAA